MVQVSRFEPHIYWSPDQFYQLTKCKITQNDEKKHLALPNIIMDNFT